MTGVHGSKERSKEGRLVEPCGEASQEEREQSPSQGSRRGEMPKGGLVEDRKKTFPRHYSPWRNWAEADGMVR